MGGVLGGLMTKVVTGSDVALWRCDCGHINVAESNCEVCEARPPHLPEHRRPDVTPVRALWEQVHAGEDSWLAERLATLKAPTPRASIARIDVAWEMARTPVVGDIQHETTRTVAGILGLNLLLQVAIIVLAVATTIDRRQSVELSLGIALMVN